MKKSQTAIEAALIITFMLVILVAFLGLMLYRSFEIRAASENQALEAIKKIIQKEVAMAQKAQEGYIRNFIIPQRAGEIQFSLSFYDSKQLNPSSPTNYSMIVIDANSYRKGLEMVDTSLPKNLFGQICNDDSHTNKISKISENITIECIPIS